MAPLGAIMFRAFFKLSGLAGAWVAALLIAAAPVGASAQAAADPGRITQKIDETVRSVLPGHVHPATRESRDVGAADPGVRADRLVMVLRSSPAREADLERFLDGVQTPGSADFHRWLAPKAFGQRFGVAASDVAKVRIWLQSKGFRVDEMPEGGRSIVLSGTIGQINAAFGVAMRRYLWQGQQHLAASVDPSIPSALAPVVRGFASLHDFRHRAAHVAALAPPDFTSGTSNYLAPDDYATIYDVTAAYVAGTTGTGRSIAVLGRTSILGADIANFRGFSGLAPGAPQIINNGAAPAIVPGDELESDLDIEWSGAVARAATIKFVTSASTALSDGIDLSAQFAVSNNVADIISVSYSSCETPSDVSAGPPFYHQLWQQAAAQGTSVFVSSGDWGAAGCDSAPGETLATHGLAVNQLCSSPFSTCVGGTQFTADIADAAAYWSSSNSATNASALGYIGESVWNQSGTTLYASGGGASTYFAKPAWQYATGVPSDGRRDVPDLAMAASSAHDAYLVYSSDGQSASTLLAVGGTSAATPAVAGMMALVGQKQGGRLGSVNPVLYGLSQLQDAGGAPVFHRITSGNNSVPGQSGFAASATDPSYNQATGLGSLDGAVLVGAWSSYAAPTSALVPATALVPPTTFVGAASLAVPAGASWEATVNTAASSWLSVSPTSGVGPAQLSFLAQSNGGSTRSGTITVNGLTLAVTQASAATGAPAVLTVSPAALAFGATPAGATSAAQQILVGNAGNTALVLGNPSLGGAQAGDFGVAGSCLGGVTLVAGTSCYVAVSFTPLAAGTRTASLHFASASQTATIALSGAGTPASTGAGDVPIPAWGDALLALTLLGGLVVNRRCLA